MDGPVASGAPRMILTAEECWVLLSRIAFGHVNFTRHALPSSLPVRYTVEDHDILLRTGNSALERALEETMVELEVNVSDKETGAAWRVVVFGPAAAGTAGPDRVVRIHPLDVTGHRLPSLRVA